MIHFKLFFVLASLATAAILGVLGTFASFVRSPKGIPGLDNTPLGPLDEQRRQGVERAEAAPEDPSTGLARFTAKDCEAAALQAFGWTWLEPDVEPDHAPPDTWAQI
jgi:hypothetical protein